MERCNMQAAASIRSLPKFRHESNNEGTKSVHVSILTTIFFFF
jgi:hypothetical protein